VTLGLSKLNNHCQVVDLMRQQLSARVPRSSLWWKELQLIVDEELTTQVGDDKYVSVMLVDMVARADP
jgi:hypothetical protein